ncbi:MAG: tRNA (adenosine(37)-N6)-threonylcarbamoyltransferase complex transferase subunit TsaD [Phycisphaeraceae bacterium]
MALILGIETSCDETAAAVVEDGRSVLSNVVSTQHDLHERYGGVVPEIASRAHLERLLPVVHAAVDDAGVGLAELDAIAVGNRPGLVGSLIVGASAAKALAWSLGRPLIGVDHVLAHLYAPVLEQTRGKRRQPPLDADTAPFSSAAKPRAALEYPALGLVVSGGHTSLYRIDSPTRVELLGKTIDDAVGEAYDKAAVTLMAGYPGGPKLDALARHGDPKSHKFPRPLLGPGSLDFSFSGLKTALLYAVRGTPVGRGRDSVFERDADDLSESQRADFAASFQQAVVDTLITKLKRASKHMHEAGVAPRSLIVGGGVSANSLLRERLAGFADRLDLALHIPAMGLCVDNAAMIAGLAHERLLRNDFDDLSLPVVATTAAV